MKLRFFAPLIFSALAIQSARAVTFTWTNPAGGSWGTNTNWSSAPTFAADEVLDFSTLNITANAVTTLDAARTAGGLKFGDATTVSNNWTVNAGTGGTLALSTTTGNPTITTVASGDAVTIAAPISGTQTILKAGAGTLNLTGANTFTGIFQVEPVASSIVNVSGNQSSATGGWNIRANAVVNFQTGSTIAAATGKSITLANESGADHTLNVAGTVTNSGTLSVQARGFLNINSGGSWTQNGGMTVAPSASFASSQISVNAGGSLTYAGPSAISLSSSSGTGTGGATMNLNGGTLTTSKAINNASTGTGTGGALLNFTNGGTLKLSANIASLATTAGRPFAIQVGSGGGKIDTNGFSTTLAIGITGSGSFEKLGEGTLTFTGINTYGGSTTVNAGTLSVSTDDQFSDLDSLAVKTGATLNLGFAGTDTVGNFRIDGITQATGKWGRTGAILDLGADFETSLITGDGLIDNTNSSSEFYWDGTGTAWSSPASWSFVAADASVNPPAPPAGTQQAFFGGDGLADDQSILLGGDQALSKLTFNSPVAFGFTGGGATSNLTVGSSGINLNPGCGNVTFGSSTAGQEVNLVLNAAETWTNLSSGMLTAANEVGLGSNTLTTAGTGGMTFSGAITGNGGIRKTGSGYLDLSGSSTFTGDKTVDRGSVIVAGNQGASNGNWILRGYGDTGSAYCTVATTVTFDNTSTVAVASGKSVQLGNTTASGGFQFQTLNANGNVTLDGTLFVGRAGVLNVSGNWTQNGAATVFTQGGGIAAMNIPSGGSFTYASATPFALTSSGSNNTLNDLTINGGLLVTGVKIHNATTSVTTGSSSGLVLNNGGTLKLSASVADLFTTAGATIRFVLGAGGGVVDTNGFSTTLNTAITGAGGLTKSGAGTLTTTGSNTYSGNTTVNGGVLSLAGANLNDDSAVTIATGAALNLNFSGADTIASLTINGVALPPGTYSNATHPAYITGAGSLIVPNTAGFASWASGLGLSGAANADYDHDGITDAAEYVLGTDPKVPSSSGIQTQKSGSNLVLTFSRDDASETPDVALHIEAGETLQTWPQVFHVADTTANSSAGVTITENGTAADTVVVTIPTSGAAKLFAHLKVIVSGS